ncbi:peptidylprolyl isomerase [Qipengyuania sp. DGS5-3]|uniref:peptidylprolyl isomerase n=1 Tax=Qipengyuania sp. DGS5-3 TaxID=3349632 RepID=UPI0036D404D6
MKNTVVRAAALLTLTAPVAAQEAPEGAPSPNAIVDAAPQGDWVTIPAEDLLVMELAPDAARNPRTVVIQLIPEPFSQGWVENIRTLARAEWYDGITINRVQDNYVVQWGDPNHDNPEATGEAKPLPKGLNVMGEDEYTVTDIKGIVAIWPNADFEKPALRNGFAAAGHYPPTNLPERNSDALLADRYAPFNTLSRGWPMGFSFGGGFWPVHCYGMVGVGRSYSPDTGSGAELYTVIGHAPRHLDRNIALVGRIVSGMEHLSSLPRGSGALGFYTEEEEDKRTPILSARIASDLPPSEQPKFEYLSTESETFAHYTGARANRRDPFFIVPAGGADICNIPVPVRRVAATQK